MSVAKLAVVMMESRAMVTMPKIEKGAVELTVGARATGMLAEVEEAWVRLAMVVR